MFCPPPEEESQANTGVTHKNQNRKRKRKSGRNNPQHGVSKNKRKQGKFAVTMSAWAENFTFAATWQLKHQLAYWKARAKALEYENGILHEIIRKKNFVGSTPQPSMRVESVSSQVEAEDEASEEQDDDDIEFEVSEEYIQFLQDNVKFKEEARRERERLRAKNAEENIIEEMEAGPSEVQENTEEVLKELYGDKWRRISALEMTLQSQFIDDGDKEKPPYWPNIPFNFNFG